MNLPITCHVDNIGAIFIAENVTTTSRTKHIDLRYRFIHEYIDDGFMKVIFCRSEDNKSDIFTKNVTGETFEAHIDSFVDTKDFLSTTTKRARE